MTKLSRNVSTIALMAMAAMTIVACVPKPRSPQPRHEAKYGAIYKSDDDTFYTRSLYNQQLVYWMFYPSPSPSPSYSTMDDSPAYFSSGSWQRAPSTPTGLSKTSFAVDEEEGVPTNKAEEAEPGMEDELVDEETTQDEFGPEAAEPADQGATDNPNPEGNENAGGTTGGNDTAADTGGGGGNDAGGDGGGGGGGDGGGE